MAHVQKNPAQLSKCSCRFYQQMELENMSANATDDTGRTAPASTGRTNKGKTVSKGEGNKEGLSICSRVEERQKGTTTQDGKVEARREGSISSVYCSIT